MEPRLNTMLPGPRPPPYQVASWSIQPFGHNTPTLQTDRQDNGPVALREPLLVTVAQKHTQITQTQKSQKNKL